MTDQQDSGGSPPRKPRAKAEDLAIGQRVRMRRLELGMTQEQLAKPLNIGFQQIQKYETGRNRISAYRLYQIAQATGTSIEYFFADIEKLPMVDVEGSDVQSTADYVAMINQVKEPIRGRLEALIRILAAQ